MVKKKKAKPKTVSPEKAHVQTLLFFTERNITGSGDSLDQLFKNQAKRLRGRLKSL